MMSFVESIEQHKKKRTKIEPPPPISIPPTDVPKKSNRVRGFPHSRATIQRTMGVWTFAEVTGHQIPAAHKVIRASGETCVSFFNVFSIALHGKFTGSLYANSNTRTPRGFGFLNLLLGVSSASPDSMSAVPNKGDVIMGMLVPNTRNVDKAKWAFKSWLGDMKPLFTFLMIISGGKMFGAKPPKMFKSQIKRELHTPGSSKPDGLYALAMLVATHNVQMFVDDAKRAPALRELNLGGQDPLEFACEAAMLLTDIDMKTALLKAAPWVEKHLMPDARVEGEVLSNAAIAFHTKDAPTASLSAADSYTKYETMVFTQLTDKELMDAGFLSCRARKVKRRKEKAREKAHQATVLQNLRSEVAALQAQVQRLHAQANIGKSFDPGQDGDEDDVPRSPEFYTDGNSSPFQAPVSPDEGCPTPSSPGFDDDGNSSPFQAPVSPEVEPATKHSFKPVDLGALAKSLTPFLSPAPAPAPALVPTESTWGGWGQFAKPEGNSVDGAYDPSEPVPTTNVAVNYDDL